MKSKADIVLEMLDELFEKNGWEPGKTVSKTGGFVYIKNKVNIPKYIIHIPHSSLEIPIEFKKRLTVDLESFNKENLFISDYRINEFVPKNFPNIVKFNYSRMFCDVERSLDDDKEEMSKYGMGVIYSKDSNNREFIKLSNKYKQSVIDNYYDKHHEEFNYKIEELLNIYNDCFIIDLHSFSDEFVYKMFNKTNNPDICIGINNDFNNDLLIKTINHFTDYGYSIKVNYPFSGSIMSDKYPNVKTIMLEINKRIYLEEVKYNKFYDCMMKYWDIIN